jgi:hypothetical protein
MATSPPSSSGEPAKPSPGKDTAWMLEQKVGLQ